MVINMRKLWSVFGVIILSIFFCAGCGNGQGDTISGEYSSYEQSVPSQDNTQNTDDKNTNTTSKEPQISSDTNRNQSGDASVEGNEHSESSSLSAEEMYQAILLNNGRFLCADLQNKELSLDKIKEAVTDDDSMTAAVPRFAVSDLNGDGEKEVILWIQINGISDYGFEILTYQANAVYGYTLPYTAFMSPKTDGTFLFSGGAADSGIGKLNFSENGYTVNQLCYSESAYDSNNELTVQYFANGAACTEEEFQGAMSRQEEKPGIVWYDLTADSVAAALGN